MNAEGAQRRRIEIGQTRAAAVADFFAAAEKIGQVDQRGQFGIAFEATRRVVVGDGRDQFVGQVPLLGQPVADLGVGQAEHLFFRLADIEILVADQRQNLTELVGEVLAQDQLADIVEDPRGEGLALDPVAQLAGQHPRRNPAGDRVLPELLAVEFGVAAAAGEALEHRYTQAQILDRVETENHHGVIDGGDLAGETVKGGVGQFENLGGKGLVGRDQARHVLGRSLGVVDQADHLGDDRRQGRQADNALGNLFYALLSLLVQDSGPLRP